jgi:predicted DNA-binding transcriptional regulator AlpA
MTTKLIRFCDLQERGIVNSWALLRRWIDRDGFPPGRMLGPNTRAWTEVEVEAWIKSRPTAGPAPRGAAKTRRGRAAQDRAPRHHLNSRTPPR